MVLLGNLQQIVLPKYLKDLTGFVMVQILMMLLTLYLFDKKLRLLILDAIERVEIHIRSVIAHELGRLDPIAYKRESFINPKSLLDYEREGIIKNSWCDWSEKSADIISRSTDTYITWHKNRYAEIPFWVVVETWDFGLMSNYYNILGDKLKDIICNRVGVPNRKTLNNWLKEINYLRNKCAHHSRIWNMRLLNPLNLKGLKDDDYFKNLSIRKTYPRRRIFGIISVLWFLVQKIGPRSTWIQKVADHINTLPNCESIQYHAMGFSEENGFPREKFNLSKKSV